MRDKDREIDGLKAEIEKLKDRTDLDRAIKSKEKLMVTIRQRDSQIKTLNLAIDKFTAQMIDYEKNK